jgi:hypothetical protein
MRNKNGKMELYDSSPRIFPVAGAQEILRAEKRTQAVFKAMGLEYAVAAVIFAEVVI